MHEYSGRQIYEILKGSGLTNTWVQGIGSMYGLFGSIIGFPMSGATYNIPCFKENDSVNIRTINIARNVSVSEPIVLRMQKGLSL